MRVLETFSLSKGYGRIQAVRGLDLVVERGSILGILGPNGSGKTTTLGMILDAVRPDDGSFAWFGAPPDHLARRRIGALLEMPAFYPALSAKQNLAIVATIKGCDLDRIDPVVRQVGLYERRDSPIQTYSLGMRQRTALAAALLTDPEVLVLDEPANGLDPQGIADVRKILLDVAQKGTTIVMASHVLDEVERVCTHVAVMKQGQLLAAGEIAEVLRAGESVLVGAADLAGLRTAIEDLPDVVSIRAIGPLLELIVSDRLDPADLNRQLAARGIALSHLQVRRRGLEEAFLQMVGDDAPPA